MRNINYEKALDHAVKAIEALTDHATNLFQELENLKTLIKKARLDALAEARDIAFQIEVKYAPRAKDTDCCKCDKSHAKADGAADVVDAIGEYIKQQKKN